MKGNWKNIYWFFIAAICVIIGLLIAVIVLVARDSKQNSNNIATTIRLNNGLEMPVLGIGTAYTTPDEAREAVMDAIDRGYRHIDTAHVYNTEVAVGEAVNAKIAEGVVSREDIHVTSKLWKDFMAPTDVRNAVEESLRRLNFTYVDLYLIHWPMNSPETTSFDYVDTWRVLEHLVDEGLIKSIGVSNFNSTQLDHLINNARIPPVNNQFEVHPHCLNKRLIAHCHSRNVVVTAYAPLGSPGHPQFTADSRLAINEPEILAVAQRHQKTPAQVMIRYQLQNGNVAIPKTVTRDRVITNFNVFDFVLSDEDMYEIESIGYFFRTASQDIDIDHHQYPFETYQCL